MSIVPKSSTTHPGQSTINRPPIGGLTPLTFEPRSSEHVEQLTRLFAAHLVEDWERTGCAPLGIPVGHFLRTITLWDGQTMVAFCSFDFTRTAVELIYVAPQYRRLRIAETLYRDLQRLLPELHVKGPLSPAGRALAARVGLLVDSSDEDEVTHAAAIDADFHRTISASCQHRRGNPSRGCNRCYRSALRGSARITVGNFVTTSLLVSRGLAVLA